MTSIFTRIINRDVPEEILFEDDEFICIEDIAPKAKIHYLVIAKHPWKDVTEAVRDDPLFVNKILAIAVRLTKDFGSQFRLIFNTGALVGQTVFHVHAHILSGEALGE